MLSQIQEYLNSASKDPCIDFKSAAEAVHRNGNPLATFNYCGVDLILADGSRVVVQPGSGEGVLHLDEGAEQESLDDIKIAVKKKKIVCLDEGWVGEVLDFQQRPIYYLVARELAELLQPRLTNTPEIPSP